MMRVTVAGRALALVDGDVEIFGGEIALLLAQKNQAWMPW